jgi:hypothetical protein
MRRFTLTNDSDSAARVLRVMFHSTRSIIEEVSANGRAPQQSSRWQHVFQLAPPVEPGEAIEVTVRFRGEPPLIRAHQWAGPAAPPTVAWELELSDVDVVAQFNARWDAIQKGPPSEQPAALFFAELDRHTGKFLECDVCLDELGIDRTEADFRIGVIVRTQEILRCRLKARVDKQVARDSVPRPWLAYLSTILLGLVEKHFANWCSSGEGVGSVGRAFEAFASGRLRQKHLEGEPDSGNFFFFAEFALAAIEQGIHRQEWELLLNALVRSQELYREAYGTGVSFNETGPPGRKVAQRLVGALRRRYAGKGTNDLERAVKENTAQTFTEVEAPDSGPCW